MAINDPHEAVRDVLLNASGVTNITSDVRPWMLWRTDDLPAVTYHRISREGHWSYDGALDWKQSRIQLECWDSDYDQASDLAKEVSDALDGYQDTQHGTVYVHRIRVDDVREIDQDPERGQNQPPYAVQVDAVIAWEIQD